MRNRGQSVVFREAAGKLDAERGWEQPGTLLAWDRGTVPRQPRIDLPGVAQHVIQRGNDRQPCFFTDADYQRGRATARLARPGH
jgi:hypothetical protein